MCSQWHDGCYGDRRSSPIKEDLFLSPDPDTSFCVSGLSASSWITFSTDHLNSTLKSGCGPRGVAAVGVHVRVFVWKSWRQWCVREGVKQCYVNIFICEEDLIDIKGCVTICDLELCVLIVSVRTSVMDTGLIFLIFNLFSSLRMPWRL